MQKSDGKTHQVVVNNIKKYRELAKISQEDLSLKLGKKKDFIEKLEDKGMYRRFVTVVLIDDIAKILNVPTARFFDKTIKDTEQF